MESVESDDTSFIVLGSQTQESELVHPGELYHQLHALSNNNNNDKMVRINPAMFLKCMISQI